jgi:hypothetical protein
MKSTYFLLPFLLTLALPAPALAQQLALTEAEAEALFEQIRLLEERQELLEQEIDILRQQLNEQSPPSDPGVVDLEDAEPGIVTAEAEPTPGGIDLSVGLWSFTPRLSGFQDFAIVDPGNALVVGGELAAVDYEPIAAARFGGDVRFKGSGIDIGFNTFSFEASGSARAVAPPNGFLVATLAAPAQNELAETASARSTIHYTATDLEVGYRFNLGSAVEGRVFTGLRFADIDQGMTVRYDGIDFTDSELDMNRTFSGEGLRLGGAANVPLGAGFSLFGRASGALMLGDVSFRQTEIDNDGLDTLTSLENTEARLVPMIELATGLNWQGNLSEDSRINLSFGYLFEQWFNVLDDVRFVDSSGIGVITQEPMDLTSDGLYFELGFEVDF